MATKSTVDGKFVTPIREQLRKVHGKMVETGIAAAAIYVVIGLYLIWTLFPVYWIVSGTFKTRPELLSPEPYWIPPSFSVDSWVRLFVERPEFYQYIINSITVTLITTVLSVSLGTAATYGFVKFDFPYDAGKFQLPFFTLATRYLPPIVMVIPLFVIFQGLGLINTYWVLIFSYTAFTIPFVIWMMVGFFQELPDSLVEAAMLDGHTHFGAFFKIVLPLVKPGLIASTIFVLMTAWNELMFAVILTQTLSAQTLPVGLATFEEQYTIAWELLTVASTIALIPVVVFAFVVRDELVRGFTMGAVE